MSDSSHVSTTVRVPLATLLFGFLFYVKKQKTKLLFCFLALVRKANKQKYGARRSEIMKLLFCFLAFRTKAKKQKSNFAFLLFGFSE